MVDKKGYVRWAANILSWANLERTVREIDMKTDKPHTNRVYIRRAAKAVMAPRRAADKPILSPEAPE